MISRWDSLKPDKMREMTSIERRQNGRAPYRRIFIRPRVRESDILVQYATLRDACRLKHDDAVINMAHFVSAYCNHLPAEETAVAVVYDIFLSALSSDNTQSQTLLLHVIQTLLLNKKHASAMLVSLTTSVEESDGAEHFVVNAVRRKLFTVLHARLPASCACLTTALQAAKRIDSGSVGQKYDAGRTLHIIDSLAFQEFLESALQHEESVEITLNLLLAMLQHYPLAASSLVRSLLFRDCNHSAARASLLKGSSCVCVTCGLSTGGAPDFLKILHSGRSQVATQCATELLHSLPLHLWLSGRMIESSTPPLSTNRPKVSSGFQSAVANAIGELIRIALCGAIDGDALFSLVKGILMQVPYGLHHKCYDYEALAVTLVDKLAMSRNMFGPVLTACLGGRMTPNGQLTKASTPVVTWLRSAQGGPFVEEMLSMELRQCKLMIAVLRATPDVVLGHGSMWVHFQCAVEKHIKRSQQSIAVQLIESLLRGRQDHMIDKTSSSPVIKVTAIELLGFALPILESFISMDQTCRVQCKACDGLSCLQRSDWAAVSHITAESCIARLLTLCANPSSGADVIAASCKAVGDICTNYDPYDFFLLGRDGAAGSWIPNMILSSMIQNMTDENSATVQCMALFAVGNMMQALYDRAQPPVGLESTLVCATAESSLALVANLIEKVAVNAIRSTGFVACVVLRYREDLEEVHSEFRATFYCVRVIRSLTRNVRAAVSLALCFGETRSSWKQRSGIKKQGWGSCNVLAALFEQKVLDEFRAVGAESICQEAVSCLLDCVVNASAMTEKIAISAFAALRSLDRTSLSQMILGETTLGNVIASCSALLFGELTGSRPRNTHLCREVELLLAHLLPCITVLDAQEVLTTDIVFSYLGQLFLLIAEQECAPDIFSRFALALQSSGACIDIHLEQQLMIRTSNLEQVRHDQLDEM